MRTIELFLHALSALCFCSIRVKAELTSDDGLYLVAEDCKTSVADCCPTGYAAIDNTEDCQTAISDAGLFYSKTSTYDIDQPTSGPGCLCGGPGVTCNSYVHFNSGSETEENWSWGHLICKQAEAGESYSFESYLDHYAEAVLSGDSSHGLPSPAAYFGSLIGSQLDAFSWTAWANADSFTSIVGDTYTIDTSSWLMAFFSQSSVPSSINPFTYIFTYTSSGNYLQVRTDYTFTWYFSQLEWALGVGESVVSSFTGTESWLPASPYWTWMMSPSQIDSSMTLSAAKTFVRWVLWRVYHANSDDYGLENFHSGMMSIFGADTSTYERSFEYFNNNYSVAPIWSLLHSWRYSGSNWSDLSTSTQLLASWWFNPSGSVSLSDIISFYKNAHSNQIPSGVSTYVGSLSATPTLNSLNSFLAEMSLPTIQPAWWSWYLNPSSFSFPTTLPTSINGVAVPTAVPPILTTVPDMFQDQPILGLAASVQGLGNELQSGLLTEAWSSIQNFADEVAEHVSFPTSHDDGMAEESEKVSDDMIYVDDGMAEESEKFVSDDMIYVDDGMAEESESVSNDEFFSWWISKYYPSWNVLTSSGGWTYSFDFGWAQNIISAWLRNKDGQSSWWSISWMTGWDENSEAFYEAQPIFIGSTSNEPTEVASFRLVVNTLPSSDDATASEAETSDESETSVDVASASSATPIVLIVVSLAVVGLVAIIILKLAKRTAVKTGFADMA